jgi:RNA polymerase sigma-70 factor (ECF subfamily)
MIPDFDQYWQKIKSNDICALEKVYTHSFRYLVKYAYGLTENIQISEEIVQDVFLYIWQKRSVLEIKSSFKSYLLQCVHNHALNEIRHYNTRKESVNITGSEKTWKFITDTYDLNSDFIERIFCDETEAIIENAIMALPDQCGKVFRMSRFKSMKNNEIAVMLGISENTVKSHIQAALRKIATALGKSE